MRSNRHLGDHHQLHEVQHCIVSSFFKCLIIKSLILHTIDHPSLSSSFPISLSQHSVSILNVTNISMIIPAILTTPIIIEVTTCFAPPPAPACSCKCALHHPLMIQTGADCALCSFTLLTDKGARLGEFLVYTVSTCLLLELLRLRCFWAEVWFGDLAIVSPAFPLPPLQTLCNTPPRKLQPWILEPQQAPVNMLHLDHVCSEKNMAKLFNICGSITSSW